MKVGGTQRRLDGALTFLDLAAPCLLTFFLASAARCLLTFCLASADFRVRDSGTTSLPTGLGRLRPAVSAPGQPRRCAGPHVRAVSVVAGPPVGDLTERGAASGGGDPDVGRPRPGRAAARARGDETAQRRAPAA